MQNPNALQDSDWSRRSQLREHLLANLFVEGHQSHFGDASVDGGNGVDRRGDGIVPWPAEGACADERKGNYLSAKFVSDFQSPAVAGFKK